MLQPLTAPTIHAGFVGYRSAHGQVAGLTPDFLRLTKKHLSSVKRFVGIDS
jgi:hypothetical protein